MGSWPMYDYLFVTSSTRRGYRRRRRRRRAMCMPTVMPISQHGQETQRSLNYGWTPERVHESRGLGGGSLEPGRRSIGLVPRWARADPFPPIPWALGPRECNMDFEGPLYLPGCGHHEEPCGSAIRGLHFLAPRTMGPRSLALGPWTLVP